VRKGAAAAREIGQALYRLSREQAVTDRVREELAGVVAALRDPEVGGFFSSPVVPRGVRLRAAGQSLGSLHPLVLASLEEAIARDSSDEMAAALAELERLSQRDAGVDEAEVLAAFPLEAVEQQRLAEGMQQQAGRPCSLRVRVRESLRGGVVVRLADREIDGSIQGRLAALKRGLMRG
jgi:F-type H+-transporting ATPase subunit delta